MSDYNSITNLRKVFLIATSLLLLSILGPGDGVRSGEPELPEAGAGDYRSIVINGDDTICISKGYLRFQPKPEICICFCGEYYLEAREPRQSFYLEADSINLSQYIDKEILVAGHTFTRVCQGTLAVPCDFIDVAEVSPASGTVSAEVSWGFLKKIYGGR
ncbi:MAG: hypothetical protein R6U43_01685 [Candidatus Krumholzibacteriales bacterium]